MDTNAVSEIARSEATFRRLFEAAHDGILILDALTGEITAVNPFLTTLLGYTEAEMLGTRLATVAAFHVDGTSQIVLADLQRSEFVRYEDLPLRTRDGRTVAVEFISIAYEANGERVIQCNIRDITDRKRTEEEAFQSARVTALRASIGLSLSEPNPFPEALKACAQAFVMHFSTALAQIWVYEAGSEALTLAASAGIAAQPDVSVDGVPPGHSMIQRIIDTGEPLATNDALVDPQVSDHAWAAREGINAFAGYPLTVDGRVVGVLGLFAKEPLTEAVLATLNSLPNHLALAIDRRQRTTDLEIAEERLRFAMESARVGVWDMDFESGDLRWSETMEAQYGMQPGTFPGTFAAFAERIHPEDRESTLAAIERAGRTGLDYSLHHRTLHADGTVRWLRGEGRYVLDVHGVPVRASGISLDVTEQRVAQNKDQQAQKMEAVGRLAGGVAHDFNNLLTVMLGSCELVLDTLSIGDPSRSDVAEIQKAGLRAASLTRQLLTFSRRSVVEPQLLDINEVLGGLLPMLLRLIGEDVRIVTYLHSGAARVVADRSQMEQIIVNLAVNGRDSMPHGGTLSIESAIVEIDQSMETMHLAAKPGSYVVLTVTDTGVGMNADVLTHLFEPFFTTKPLGEGTGLGLATVHGIVLQNSGAIDVVSKVGVGTAFKVYLPQATTDGEPASASPPNVPSRGGSETILVVEDSTALRALTRRILLHAGYTVLVASSSAEAQVRFADTPEIALVLTDVVMPGGSGPELVALLKIRRPDTRAIYMSGYSEDAISHHGVLAPGIAFLQKPFDAAALRRKVREQLDL